MWAFHVILGSIAVSVGAQSCIDGGVFNSQFNKCFHFIYSPQSYREAEFVCTAISGVLVSISNAFEQSVVFGHARLKFVHSDYWIGLTNLNEPDVWEWADSSKFGYNNWEKGLPQNDTLNCVATHLNNGMWYNTDCENAKKYFVCQVDPYATSPKLDNNFCAGMGVLGQQSENCLYFMNSMQNFHDAELSCGSLHGVLVSLSDAEKQKFISGLARQKINRGDYWIGLNDLYKNDDWQWSDPVEYSYKNWAPGMPLNDSKKNCVAARSSNGKWYNSECETNENCFVCATAPAVATSPSEPISGSGWIYYGATNSWYKVLPYNGVASWETYESQCASEGAHLASIHNYQENMFVFGLGMGVTWPIMIGLKASGNLYSFAWTDKTALDYSYWAGGSPAGTAYCVSINTAWTWNNVECTAQISGSAVCKKPNASKSVLKAYLQGN